MSAARNPQLGSVIWAEMEDANGYRKARPVVVVSPTADVKGGKPLRVVAITTRLPEDLPTDHVLLPFLNAYRVNAIAVDGARRLTRHQDFQII